MGQARPAEGESSALNLRVKFSITAPASSTCLSCPALAPRRAQEIGAHSSANHSTLSTFWTRGRANVQGRLASSGLRLR